MGAIPAELCDVTWAEWARRHPRTTRHRGQSAGPRPTAPGQAKLHREVIHSRLEQNIAPPGFCMQVKARPCGDFTSELRRCQQSHACSAALKTVVVSS